MKKLIVLSILTLVFTGGFSQTVTGLDELSIIREGVKSKRVSSYDRSGGNNDRMEGIQPGETKTLFDVQGAGIIKHIWITIAPPPEQLSRNDIILKMYWDGNEFLSVESPIGPFFGQGWNESYAFSSLPLAAGPVDGRGLVCYFQMPFAEGAKILIENQADKAINAFYYYVDYLEMDELPENMGRFCAWYNHELTDAPEEGENEWGSLGEPGKNPTGDDNYVFADIKGKGHYVGINYYVHSPGPMWYGEGDDMFFIDGEKKASLHGTGTEDYFNTSWCPKTIFTHPYYGYGRVNEDIGWLGRTHVYRFHISDPVYFDKSLRVTIEHGHNNCLTLDLASVAYWYQRPPLNPLPAAPTKEERSLKPFIQPYDIHRWRHEWRMNNGGGENLWGNKR